MCFVQRENKSVKLSNLFVALNKRVLIKKRPHLRQFKIMTPAVSILQNPETHKKQTGNERSPTLGKQARASRRQHGVCTAFSPREGAHSAARNTLPRVKFPPERTQMHDDTQL